MLFRYWYQRHLLCKSVNGTNPLRNMYRGTSHAKQTQYRMYRQYGEKNQSDRFRSFTKFQINEKQEEQKTNTEHNVLLCILIL